MGFIIISSVCGKIQGEGKGFPMALVKAEERVGFQVLGYRMEQ